MKYVKKRGNFVNNVNTCEIKYDFFCRRWCDKDISLDQYQRIDSNVYVCIEFQSWSLSSDVLVYTVTQSTAITTRQRVSERIFVPLTSSAVYCCGRFEKVHVHVESDGRRDVLTGKTRAFRFDGAAKRFRKKPKALWTEQPREESSSKYIFFP